MGNVRFSVRGKKSGQRLPTDHASTNASCRMAKHLQPEPGRLARRPGADYHPQPPDVPPVRTSPYSDTLNSNSRCHLSSHRRTHSRDSATGMAIGTTTAESSMSTAEQQSSLPAQRMDHSSKAQLNIGRAKGALRAPGHGRRGHRPTHGTWSSHA